MDGTHLRTSSYECRIITSYSPSDTGLGYSAGNNVTRFYLYPFKLRQRAPADICLFAKGGRSASVAQPLSSRAVETRSQGPLRDGS